MGLISYWQILTELRGCGHGFALPSCKYICCGTLYKLVQREDPSPTIPPPLHLTGPDSRFQLTKIIRNRTQPRAFQLYVSLFAFKSAAKLVGYVLDACYCLQWLKVAGYFQKQHVLHKTTKDVLLVTHLTKITGEILKMLHAGKKYLSLKYILIQSALHHN